VCVAQIIVQLNQLLFLRFNFAFSKINIIIFDNYFTIYSTFVHYFPVASAVAVVVSGVFV